MLRVLRRTVGAAFACVCGGGVWAWWRRAGLLPPSSALDWRVCELLDGSVGNMGVAGRKGPRR